MAKTTRKPEPRKQTKKTKSAVGAPSQLSQSTRSGKKAWRKNIDIDPVEEGLETIRSEERVVGTALHNQPDKDLFTVDVTGDDGGESLLARPSVRQPRLIFWDAVRRRLPKFSKAQLTSTKILSQRSAVPAVSSRAAKKSAIDYRQKGRMLRIARRTRRGPFNAVMDPTEFGAGSAPIDVSEAVKKSGKYDIWEGDIEALDAKVRRTVNVCNPETEASKNRIKVPSTSHPRSMIELPAISTPHQGASYNPPVEAYQDLLRSAHEIEEAVTKNAGKGRDVHERMTQARHVGHITEEGLPPGMTLHEVDAEGEEETATPLVKPPPPRKTKKQRRKFQRALEEVRISSVSRDRVS